MDDTKRHKGEPSLRELLKSELSELADALAEHQYQCGFSPMVTLDDCVSYYKKEAEKLNGPIASGFILSVRKNLDPRNENDNFIVAQGLINKQNELVVVNGESVSRVIHTRTIDDKLIKVLNGQESVIIQHTK